MVPQLINWQGLASNESAGLLYTLDSSDGFKLKSMTAADVLTTIGTGTKISGVGMAYDDANDILYTLDDRSSQYTIDTSSGTSTFEGIANS